MLNIPDIIKKHKRIKQNIYITGCFTAFYIFLVTLEHNRNRNNIYLNVFACLFVASALISLLSYIDL